MGVLGCLCSFIAANVPQRDRGPYAELRHAPDVPILEGIDHWFEPRLELPHLVTHGRVVNAQILTFALLGLFQRGPPQQVDRERVTLRNGTNLAKPDFVLLLLLSGSRVWGWKSRGLWFGSFRNEIRRKWSLGRLHGKSLGFGQQLRHTLRLRRRRGGRGRRGFFLRCRRWLRQRFSWARLSTLR